MADSSLRTLARARLAAAEQLARQQDGAITLDQARAVGLSKGHLARLVRSGHWTRAHRGAYLTDGADPVLGRARAMTLRRPGVFVCSITAARVLGLPALPGATRDEPVHLLVSGPKSRHPTPGVIFHHGEPDADDVHRHRGIPITSISRTLTDLLLLFDRWDAVAVLDAAVRGEWLRDVQALRPRLFGRRGAAARYMWLGQVDSRAESPLETRGRLILHDAGLPPEELQYNVRDPRGGFVGRVDFAWPSCRVYAEADGLDAHSAPAALLHDRERQTNLSALGWRVARFTWADTVHRPGWIVAQVARLLTIATGGAPL